MAGRASVIFSADTGQYVRALHQMDEATAKAADAVAATKNRILEYNRQQIQSAIELGKSRQDLERINSKTARMMSEVTEKNAKDRMAAVDREIAKHREWRAEMSLLPKLPSHGSSITEKQAAQAAVRTIDGNMGIRPVENFISTIPGVGRAVQTLFPLIGGAGLAGMLVEMGVKGEEAFEKVEHAAESTRNAFADLHDKSQVLIDDKEIENQKIQDQIDKISGHPNNGLASALLEAKKMADQLIVSLQEDRKQLEALFKEQDLGMFGKAMSALNFGPKSTGEQEKNVLHDNRDDESKLHAARDTYNDAMAKAPDEAARDAATKAFDHSTRKVFDDRIAIYKREVARLQKEQTDSEARHALAQAGGGGKDFGGLDTNVIDNSNKVNQLQGVIDLYETRRDVTQLDESIYAGNKKLGQAKQDKAGDKAEGASKAAEEQMKAIELADAQLKAKFAQDHASLLGAQAAFWERLVTINQDGSAKVSASILPANHARVLDQYAAAEEAYTRGLGEAARHATEEQKRANAEQQKTERDGWDKDYEAWIDAGHRSAQAIAEYWSLRAMETTQGSENQIEALRKAHEAELQWDRQMEDAARARKNAALQLEQIDARRQESGLRIAERNGQISPRDAALQQADIHTQQFDAEHATLQDEYDRQKQADPNEQLRSTIEAATALRKAEAERNIQIQEDAASVAATQWENALTSAFDNWYQHATDKAGQIAQLFSSTMKDLNQNLVDEMSGDSKQGDWKKMGHDLSKQVAGDALEEGEANVLGAFGLAPHVKADGSAEKPFHVVMGGGNALGSGDGSQKDGMFAKAHTLFDKIFHHGHGDFDPSAAANPGAAPGANPEASPGSAAMSAVMGVLGLGGAGKPDGSQSNPFHVVSAGNGGGGGAGGMFSKLLGGNNDGSGDGSGGGGGLFSSLFGGGGSSASGGGGLADFFGGDAESGGFTAGMDGVASTGTDFLGGWALGGNIPEPGGFADVGEMGRERVWLPGGSRVQPNHELRDKAPDIHIDARGSHDPAQTEAAVHRAIRSYIPHIVGASVQAVGEKQRRQPSTKR